MHLSNHAPGGRGGAKQSKATKEELDADLDAYFLKDGKTAAQVQPHGWGVRMIW